MTYSPKHVGFITGMVGVFASPNKALGAGLLGIGWAYDNMATWFDRRMKKDDEENAD